MKSDLVFFMFFTKLMSVGFISSDLKICTCFENICKCKSPVAVTYLYNLIKPYHGISDMISIRQGFFTLFGKA